MSKAFLAPTPTTQTGPGYVYEQHNDIKPSINPPPTMFGLQPHPGAPHRPFHDIHFPTPTFLLHAPTPVNVPSWTLVAAPLRQPPPPPAPTRIGAVESLPPGLV